jgi:hypothetical protein
VDVAFAFDGPRYLLEAKWEADPISGDPIRKLHSMIEERLPGSVGVALSWSGFNDNALRYATGSSRHVIMLDRTHFEAILTGATSAQEIMSAAHRFLSVLGQEYTPLASMLRPRTGTPTDQVALGAPDGFGPEAVAAPGGLDAQILLHGTGLHDLVADGDCLLRSRFGQQRGRRRSGRDLVVDDHSGRRRGWSGSMITGCWGSAVSGTSRSARSTPPPVGPHR